MGAPARHLCVCYVDNLPSSLPFHRAWLGFVSSNSRRLQSSIDGLAASLAFGALMKALLLALTVAAAAGAYLGGPGATSLLAPRKPTARRCPPPLALAGRWINGPGDKQGDGWTDDDDAALAHHISAHASTAKCGEPERILHGIDSAWVLIFNVGRHDEGVYTLQGRASCPTAYVLAFERTDDAERFAQQLSSEGFDLAKPLQWDVAQISAFCSAGEFEISLVPVREAPLVII